MLTSLCAWFAFCLPIKEEYNITLPPSHFPRFQPAEIPPCRILEFLRIKEEIGIRTKF